MADKLTVEGVTVGGKLYHPGNCNDYQKTLLNLIAEQKVKYDALRKTKGSRDAQTKQLGVIEHYCSLLPEFDEITKVEHLWDK